MAMRPAAAVSLAPPAAEVEVEGAVGLALTAPEMVEVGTMVANVAGPEVDTALEPVVEWTVLVASVEIGRILRDPG
jgi:hypothetical protein